MDSNSRLKLVIGVLAVTLAVALGLIIGILIGRGGSPKAEVPEVEEVQNEPVVEEVKPAKVEEKTYGYFPSFYMKKIYYTVPADEDEYKITYYLDSDTKIDDAYTDCRWLDEGKIGKGGNMFEVDENKTGKTRKGKLFIIDDKGRKITVYVTQKG